MLIQGLLFLTAAFISSFIASYLGGVCHYRDYWFLSTLYGWSLIMSVGLGAVALICLVSVFFHKLGV